MIISAIIILSIYSDLYVLNFFNSNVSLKKLGSDTNGSAVGILVS
jgi:hypothetical protein